MTGPTADAERETLGRGRRRAAAGLGFRCSFAKARTTR
jgi:hypothetical protein